MQLRQLYRDGAKLARLALGVRSRLPREVQLEVTNRCNLDCDMCPRLALLGVPEVDMSPETFAAVLGRLRDPERVTLTGWGEPLMHPHLLDFVDQIAARFRSAQVGFTTNGHLLTDGVVEQVLARPLAWVTVSLEELPWEGQGPAPAAPQDHRTGNPLKGEQNLVARDGHPTPPRVVERLGRFLGACAERRRRGEPAPRVLLQVVLFPGGEQTTLRLVDFAADLGFSGVNLVRLDVRGRPDLRRPTWTEERRLLALARERAAARGLPLSSVNDHGPLMRLASHGDRFCVRLDSFIYVDVEGRVAPCCLLRDLRLGDLRTQSLEEVWGSPAFKRFYGPGPHPACAGCDAFLDGYAPAAPAAVVAGAGSAP